MLMLGVAACGSDDDDDSGGSSNIGAQTGSKKQQATEAGTEMAQSLGTADLPPDVTVGVINQLGSSEGGKRAEDALYQALKTLGWSWESCDGEGDPRKIAACGQRMLNEDVDVIASVAATPSIMARQIREAKQRDIPWFNFAGAIDGGDVLTASYVPDDTAMTKAIDAYLFDAMEKEGVNTLAIQFNTFIGALKVRYDTLQEDLKQQTGIEVVAKNETDLADPQNSVTAPTRTVLTANPDIGAFWTSIDFEVPAVGATAKAVLKNGKLPMVVGFYGNSANLQAIRDGIATAVVEQSLEATGWVTADQIAQLLARETQASDDEFVEDTYPLDFMKPIIIDSENMPPEGEYAEPPADFVSFFKAKWREEFGAGK
jgi:ABC-type sugar transport system substrate-binding protein